MKIRPALLALILGTMAVSAQARKDCAELKSEIDAQLQNKGVKNYRLDIVATAEVGIGTVVGQCDGNTRRIVYSRGSAAASDKPANTAAANTAGKPPALGNY